MNRLVPIKWLQFGAKQQTSLKTCLLPNATTTTNTVVANQIRYQFLRYSSSSNMSKKLANKVAIVTGSTEGIGFAIAKRLAQDGAKVVVSSRKKEKVERAVSELKAQFADSVIGTVCHVGAEKDRQHLIQYTLDNFGAIDILVSNVAVNPHFGSFIETTEAQWDKIFEVNVKAPYLLTQSVVPHMLKNQGPGDKGSIIYISSIAGYSGLQAIGAYGVSKTALLGLCRNMSMELAVDKIRVNLVAPGVIKTKFSDLLTMGGNDEEYIKLTHQKRIGDPDEIGGVVSFLSGPDASYVTGENIVVAGGYHCRL